MAADSFLPFSRPDLDGSELELIRDALASGWITTGAMTRRLEGEFATRVGAKFAVAVNSCTAALHLALEATGIGPGDEVITSPYTFASTAEVVRYLGAHPRFVDIESDTFNIDPTAVAGAIGLRTRAIVPVHVAGQPAEMDQLDDIASAHGLAVVEDAAHALPSSYHGAVIGSRRAGLGSVPQSTCFSFYATKTMTTGEGGMICTDDESIAERCRLMSLHGISKDAWNRYAENGSWYYEIVAPGFKYNMTDVAAAMGLAQLARLDVMSKRRAQIAACYSEAFTGIPGLDVPTCRSGISHSWHLYMLRLEPDCLLISRDQFVEELGARGIGTSVHFIPLHLHPYYRETYGFSPEDFPVATREYRRELSLPIYSCMDDKDVARVIEAVTSIARKYRG